ncbi:MAG: hypothetical protein EP329_11760, partial [Deltaproteobacteria bacterium]
PRGRRRLPRRRRPARGPAPDPHRRPRPRGRAARRPRADLGRRPAGVTARATRSDWSAWCGGAPQRSRDVSRRRGRC